MRISEKTEYTTKIRDGKPHADPIKHTGGILRTNTVLTSMADLTTGHFAGDSRIQTTPLKLPKNIRHDGSATGAPDPHLKERTAGLAILRMSKVACKRRLRTIRWELGLVAEARPVESTLIRETASSRQTPSRKMPLNPQHTSDISLVLSPR